MEFANFQEMELVRNQYKRILTITSLSPDGKVYVQEEPDPYILDDLERIDQTNIVKFKPRYY